MALIGKIGVTIQREDSIDSSPLAGRRALVCGSTRGIGRACAFELAALGARVTLLARDERALLQTRDELAKASQLTLEHDYVVADFADAEQVQQCARQCVDFETPVHILVNNTGGPAAGPIVEAVPADLLAALSSHLLCNHLLAQVVLPGMKRDGYGRIVNIVSTSVKQPIPNLGVSNTVRAAVASWSKTLAGEVARFGITVNNVLPGATLTDRLRSLMENRARSLGVTPRDIEQSMKAEIPARRFAQPEEIAAAVGFLASPAAAYITGVSLTVDGGRTTCL